MTDFREEYPIGSVWKTANGKIATIFLHYNDKGDGWCMSARTECGTGFGLLADGTHSKISADPHDLVENISMPNIVPEFKQPDQLRDWFAGMAMQGELVSDTAGMLCGDSLAKLSYNIADAMMKERKQNGIV